jgi:IS605 OrfB family transposase
MKLAMKIKLNPTLDIAEAIDASQLVYTSSYNRVLESQSNNQRINRAEIHNATYYQEKMLSGLPSQLTCSLINRATETLKSVRKKARESGKPTKQPSAKKPIPIRYDKNSMTLNLDKKVMTFSTLEGRKRLAFDIPEYYQGRLDKLKNVKTKGGEIWKDKHGKYFITMFIECDTEPFDFNSKVVGIDLGIKKPAVTSLNKFLGKGHWNTVGQRYFEVRRSLQAKGTKSAKRRLRQRSRKENGFRRDCDHVLSRRIVDSVEPGTILVLEDLTGIRKKKYGKEFNRKLHTWSFFRLTTYTRYKAELKGCRVELIDPRYTSQECSECHYISKGNRKTQNHFKCKKCGFEIHADLNASRNMASRYSQTLSQGISLAIGVQSITPDVGTIFTYKPDPLGSGS